MKSIIAILVLIIIGAGAAYYFQQGGTSNTGDEPLSAIEWDNATADDIRLDFPEPNATLGRTFTVTGAARGPWYFEASFPVQVVSNGGTILLDTFAEAQGDWMTEEFVAFSKEITVPEGYTGDAWLVLHRDNASGLPENDKSVSIPIVIK